MEGVARRLTLEREHEVVEGIGIELVGLFIVLLLVLLDRALHDLNGPLAVAISDGRVRSQADPLTSKLWDMAGFGWCLD